MAKIRKDLEGVAMAVGPVGEPIILRAGDKVPEGIEVGDHLIEKKSGKAADDQGDQGETQSPEGAGSAAGEDESGGGGTGVGEADGLLPPPLAGAGSGADAWRAYAVAATKAAGLQLDLTVDAKRGDIVEALKSAGIATE